MECWLISSHRSLYDSDRLWLDNSDGFLDDSDGFLDDSDGLLVNSGRFTAVAIGAFIRSCIKMSFRW